jgi:hypothetical protein
LVDFILDSVIIYKKEDKMKILLSIIIITTIFTGCMTNSLSNTCKKFGMEPATLEAIGLDHDIDGKGFRQIKLTCEPKLKLKDK